MMMRRLDRPLNDQPRRARGLRPAKRQAKATLAAILAAVLLAASPALARSGPMPDEWYDNTDPLDLIGHHQYMTARTLGVDVWEVWVCDPVGPSSFTSMSRFMGYTPRMVTDWLVERSNIASYFRWLSNEKYEVRFRVGGTVSPDMTGVAFGEYTSIWTQREACKAVIMEMAKNSKADGVLILNTNESFYTTVGAGWGGHKYCRKDKCKPFPHANSGRYVFVDGNSWVNVYLHEIGHAISWSHSHHLDSSKYSNPMDVMSGSVGWVGTTAINRYAAGWIDPDDVKVWELGDNRGTYRLDPLGETGGYQMLVIRDSESTWYYTLGARVRDRFDSHIPQEGVEVYVVDESADAGCDWEGWDWCPGEGRKVVALGEAKSTDHVFGVGESTELPLWDGDGWVNVAVSVRERKGESFTVRVEYG